MRNRQPAGVPIGRALDIPAGIANDEVREVVAAIDRVHGDGDLPRVPVRLVTGIADLGRFLFDPDTGRPIGIVVRANQSYHRLTLLHEVGHFLDWHVFGGDRSFGSTGNPLLRDWHATVGGSYAFRLLGELAQDGAGQLADGRIIELTERELLAVTRSLLPEECWARSYAQYCAFHARLHREVSSLRTRPSDRVYYPLQWDDDDFAPIAAAIDDLFVVMGWRA